MNQINSMRLSIEVWEEMVVQKFNIRFIVEGFFGRVIDKLGGLGSDGAENLLRIPRSLGWNRRLGVFPRPGLVEGGRLAKRGFVLMNDDRPFYLGVFFRLG